MAERSGRYGCTCVLMSIFLASCSSLHQGSVPFSTSMQENDNNSIPTCRGNTRIDSELLANLQAIADYLTVGINGSGTEEAHCEWKAKKWREDRRVIRDHVQRGDLNVDELIRVVEKENRAEQRRQVLALLHAELMSWHGTLLLYIDKLRETEEEDLGSTNEFVEEPGMTPDSCHDPLALVWRPAIDEP